MSVRTLADTSVGDTIEARTIAVGRESLVAYASASGDQNRIHQDEAFATSVGLPDVIAHGMWTMGATGAVVEEWAGDGGRVVEFGSRFTKPVVVPEAGGAIEVRGVVKSVDEQTRRATLELTVTSGGDKVLGRCLAVVQLD